MRKALAFLFACACAHAMAADTVIDWTEYEASYTGSFTDVHRWSPQTYGYPGSMAPNEPGSIAYQVARFNQIDADFNVTFPSGLVNSYANFIFYGAPGRVTEFQGQDSYWELPATSVANYNYNPFLIYAGDKASALVSSDQQWGTVNTEAVLEFTNFHFRVSNTGGVRRVDFLAGDYLFDTHRIYFFTGNATSTENLIVDVAPDCGVFGGVGGGGTLGINSAGPENTLTVHGTTGGFAALSFIGTDPARKATWHLAEGANYTMGGSVAFGNVDARIVVDGGSKLTGGNADVTQSAAAKFTGIVSGTGSSFALRHMKIGDYAGAAGTMTVKDGATFSNGGNIKLGGSTAANASGFGGFYVTNSEVEVKSDWTAYNGEFVFGTGAYVKFNSGVQITAAPLEGETARFVADGLTVYHAWGVQTGNAKGVINGFTTAELGNGGITYAYVNNYKIPTYTVPLNFRNLTGCEGKVAFEGTVYGILTGTDSSEEHLIIGNAAGYTVTMSGEAKHYSNLIVKNGAKLVLQGATQTGATFKSVTLGEGAAAGVLALDADEPVTVDGAISFVKGELSFGTTLSYATHTVFRQIATASTVGQQDAWTYQNGVSVTSGLPGGAYVKHLCLEDDGYVLYQIKVAAARPALTGDATWAGSGSEWATAANWTDETKPTENLRAVFASATPKAVTLPSDAVAAALRFAADGYWLSGGALELSDNASAAIEVTAGAASVASPIVLGASTTVSAADETKLTLAGRVVGRGIVKSGTGALSLTDANSVLADGISHTQGTLVLGGENAFSATAPLKVDAIGTASNAVAVKALSDATLPLGAASQGSLLKYGKGRLTLTANIDTTLNLRASAANAAATTDYAFDETSFAGTEPHGSVSIAEGELVVRGVNGARPTITIPAPSGDNNSHFLVGMRVATPSAADMPEPGLVVDHAGLVIATRELILGNGLAPDKTYARTPYVTVTNNSVLSVRNFNSSSSMTAGSHVEALFDNSILYVNQIYGNLSQLTTVTNRFTFRNGSSLFQSASPAHQGSVVFDFDRSGCYGATSNELNLITIGTGFSESSGFICRYSFRNGSRYSGKGFRFTAASTTSSPCELIFDGSEWYAGTADAVIPTPVTNIHAKVVLEGSGVVMATPAAATWTCVAPFVGSGALVKQGAGTLFFDCQQKDQTVASDPITLAHTGLTDVQAGTLRIAQGAISNFVGRSFRIGGALNLSGGVLPSPVLESAGGLVCHGEYATPTVKVAVDAEGAATPLTFDYANGCVVSGRTTVDFCRADDDPLTKGAVLTVANWTGTKPDVSTWRSVNCGADLRCTFAANDNGTITATVGYKGGLLIVVR